MLKFVLLGFLNYRPMTGYDLKGAINRSTSHFWHAELSQIYVTLKALEKEGRVRSEVEAQDERPDRRVYFITPQGQADLQEWLAQPLTELTPKKDNFLLKLFFSAALDKERLLAQLRWQRELHARRLRMIQNEMAGMVQQSAGEYPQLAKDALLWEATRRLGEAQQEATLRWLEETIDMVEEEF